MTTNSILISGATGFIGSHIAEEFANNNFKIIALTRNKSNLWRLNEIKKKNIIVLNTDDPNFAQQIQKYKPICFIHCGWDGVGQNNRNDWIIQSKNIEFTLEMLLLSNELGIKKVIALGSQAEYGDFEGRISENAVCNPNNAYGAAKLAAQHMLKSFCDTHNINWIWLRTFSIYGERENEGWLISSLIKNVLCYRSMNLTKCEQRYDYVYAGDFAKAILRIIDKTCKSDVYNLSSDTSIQIKILIEKILEIINHKGKLKFGTLPYRENQIMHMEGDSSKFIRMFNFSLNSNFENKLEGVVNYYKTKFMTTNESF